MKRIAIIHLALLTGIVSFSQADNDSFYTLSPVEVKAIRVAENTPFTRSNLGRTQLNAINTGQDIPFLLRQLPSVVSYSDAGNGIGYTGLRIRGTDATRINVTLNGIPYNDAESQGTFFVDLPDITSSTGSIQVQRGVGTSSNGAGAFGASINISTNELNQEPYTEISNSYGSFDSWKHTVRAGTGLLNEHFTVDVRLSRISSSGFIDRASSDLRSFYLSTAWLNKRSSLKFNIISGNEKTYQAWNGISETDLKNGNYTYNSAGTSKPGEPYENETDNFRQDHYQLFFNTALGKHITFNTALFLTKGKGYYEQYRDDETYADYGITIPGNTDLVRQLWLDNDFYGSIFSFQRKKNAHESTLGGSLTRYKGLHFGDVIWAASGMPSPKHRWYDNDAFKNDANIYFKHNWQAGRVVSLFADVQYRYVDYKLNGFRDNPSLNTGDEYHFFNPKAGVTLRKNKWRSYLSFAVANKEPNRDDFEAATYQLPKPERLYNTEAGFTQYFEKGSAGITLYHMLYRDQLVLTGKINDVGAYTRTNIKNSYRAGIEIEGSYVLSDFLNISGNASFSRNRLKNFEEYLDDYDMGGQKLNIYDESEISFSPSVIANFALGLKPVKNLEVTFISKYTGSQYLDNTQNEQRKLKDFFLQDARINYQISAGRIKDIRITAQLNNIFDRMYQPNGYTFSYIYGGETITENFYFPMAGRNFMLGVAVML